MKRILLNTLLIFAFVIAGFHVSAQHVGRLYGMTYGGGTDFYQYGVFFCYDSSTNTETVLQNYASNNGENPYGNVIQAKDGKLYGMTAYGGTQSRPNGGTLFSYDMRTLKYTIVHDFPSDSMDGEQIYGSLMQASNDSMYGLTRLGQNCLSCAGSGTLFSFDPATSAETVRVGLRSRLTGANPTGNLIQATNGLLYGCGYVSHGNGPGTIFSYNIDSNTARIIFTFNTTDGEYPRGSLIQATNGLLYGLTYDGGSNGMGVLFSFDLSSNTETVLHNFTGAPNDGANPGGSLIQAKDGNLYGMDTSGGLYNNGVLFRYDIGTNTETIIHNFKGDTTDGGTPFADVIQASDGQLWGMTNVGGRYNYGTVFAYNLTTNVEKIIINFDTLNGNLPYGDLTEVFYAWDSIKNNTCSNGTNGSIALYQSGGKPPFTYSWSIGATTSSVTGLSCGTYTCSITDSRGIAFTFYDTVGPLPEVINFAVSNACLGDTNGSATALISGGTSPFTFTWSNGQSNDTAMNLAQGTYTCSTVDANGCAASGTVTITQAAPMVINSVVATPQTWPNYNGIITVNVSGGIPPGNVPCYLYVWSNGAPDSSIVANMDTGTYAVCITSCYGCGSLCDSNIVIVMGIQNLSNPNNLISVYPIPSKGALTINMKGDGFENLEITDAIGRQVYYQSLSPNLKDSTIHVDLSALSDGVYIMHINSTHGLLTRKIIIQK